MPGTRGAAPQFDFNTFKGFAAPGSTPVPDIFFDLIMPHLADVELRVLLYFFRRTFGFKKFSDNISIGQMVNGIETRDGKKLDYGCGLSKSGVTKGLRGLLRKNLIVATRRSDPKRGHLPTNYSLNMKGTLREQASLSPDTSNEALDEPPHRTPPLSPGVNKGVALAADKGSPPRGQALSLVVDTQETVTNTQFNKVVNAVTDSDHQPMTADRKSTTRRTPTISNRALKTTYGLSDDGVAKVHWLVDRQVEILGARERNHASYVKRAAEAVRDGDADFLDYKLGDFRQAATAIGIGNPPAYFHAMYLEALRERREGAAPPDALPRRVGVQRVGQTLADSSPGGAGDTDDARARLIADAERRGFVVPDHVRRADLRSLQAWWARLPETTT